MTILELLAAEQSRESYDPNQDLFYEDPNGKAVIYYSRPLSLVADGETVDIKKMQVKIADFGKGFSFLLFGGTDKQQLCWKRAIANMVIEQCWHLKSFWDQHGIVWQTCGAWEFR